MGREDGEVQGREGEGLGEGEVARVVMALGL
jgi:hypothetical protein